MGLTQKEVLGDSLGAESEVEVKAGDSLGLRRRHRNRNHGRVGRGKGFEGLTQAEEGDDA